MKTTRYKSRKTGIFAKRLVHSFGQKVESLPPFTSGQNRPGKCVL